MTWQDFALACQLLVEERIGTRVREAKAAEEAKFKAAAATLPRG
jgi:hypothetical protein